jgi:hypothetical protein
LTRAYVATLIVALAACTTAHDDARSLPAKRVAIEPNDVAILYPPSGGSIAVSEVVPRAIYVRAFGAEGALQLGGTPAPPRLDELVLIAIRIDPEREQLRLVFQPRNDRDDAVHAFFTLDRGEARELAGRIASLRGEVALGPLAPHPLLVQQGPNGAFANALATLVRRYANPAKLARITVITSSGLGTAWNFFGVDIGANGGTTPVAIPTLPAGTHLEAFFAGFVEGELTGEPAFTPESTTLAASDDLRLLANHDRFARATAADRRRAAMAAARIEDPVVHTSETIDCASCHVAHLVQTRGSANVHMFGYDHGRPSIQPRTIREVDASVTALNAR